MKKSSDDNLRKEIIGLGKNSIRKNYYRSLQEKQKDLEEKNKELEAEITHRKEIENKLKELNEVLESRIKERTSDLDESNKKLQHTIDNLEKSYEYLIEAEKLASLNHLVKGISHEINTPLGASLTTTTYVSSQLNTLIRQLKKSDSNPVLIQRLMKINLSIDLILEGIESSAALTNSLKQLSSMHNNHERQLFSIEEYTDTIIKSMQSKVNHFDSLAIDVKCKENLIVDGYPGIFTQIFTILLANSLTHAFDEKGGHIFISFEEDEHYIYSVFKDDGKGLDESLIQYVFDPFFTTSMSGTTPGLGLFTAYNLVKSMSGDIKCYNDNGFRVDITIPKTLKRFIPYIE